MEMFVVDGVDVGYSSNENLRVKSCTTSGRRRGD